MILTLEVTSSQGAKLGASRQVFRRDGGTIGRESDNSWVLPHPKVSGHHALISYRNAVYYIEDTSRNGVCLNSSRNHLTRGRPYALTSGDRIFIDPYEISVTIAGERDDTARESFGALSDLPSPVRRVDASSPFGTEDPFAQRPIPLSELASPVEELPGQELDPLKLLDPMQKQASGRRAPSARDLELGSPLEGHYKPPAALPASAPPPPLESVSIPHDYDPLAPDDSHSIPPSRVAQRPRDEPAPIRSADVAWATPPPISSAPAPAAPIPRAVPDPVAPAASTDEPDASGPAAILEGAGLERSDVTPALARSFGRILRVVVSGVMDVLRSRQQIKDEFRMRVTRFRTAENNPLKFSANVDDALHNLLVKRNAAYLGPVEAFEDAFDDLRNHQIAMLAGMRVAFEAMLTEFDPDRLQERFDGQLGKGSIVPAKLRYWELYRNSCRDIARDPEASFRRLFGDEFARAYEDQLKQLKAQGRLPDAPASPPRSET